MSRNPVTSVPASADQPAIRGFQLDEGGVGRIARSVNCFRGDVNLPWQFVDLEGLNDIAISLTAFYASNLGNSALSSNAYAPTSILGLGWSLPLSRVVVQRKTTASPLDGIYYLEYEGQMHLLIWVGESDQGESLRFAVKQEPLWIIEYTPKSETWTLFHENGNRSIFGGAPETGALEYGILWDNWAGGASTVTDPAPSQYVVAWNLAKTQTVWGNWLRFSYLADNVSVGGTAGASYTRGSYLSLVEDLLGQGILLDYCDKKSFEYVPPHQSADGSPNPAYQDRYGTKALHAIDVCTNFADDGGLGREVVQRLEFDYDFRDLARKDKEHFKKRLLVAIRDIRAGAARSPAVRFDYNAAKSLRPGALRQVIFPEGANSTYMYRQIPLGEANEWFRKNMPVRTPLAGSTPRVWHGPDYLVILWHDETRAASIVQVFSQGGTWSKWQCEVPGNLNLGDVRAAFGAEIFALYMAPKSPSGEQRLHLFRRKQYQFGNWDHDTESVEVNRSIKADETSLAIGVDFVVFNVGGTTTVHRFTYDRVTEKWCGESLDRSTASNVAVAAFGYYYIAGYYEATSGSLQYHIFYRDRSGRWREGQVGPVSSNVQWLAEYAGSLWALAGNFAVATFYERGIDRPKLHFLWWDASFEVIGAGPSDGDTSSSAVYGSTVANGKYVYRFDAGSWKEWNFGPGSANYAYGEDFAIRVSATGEVSIAAYDPTDKDWSPERRPSVDSPNLFAPTFSERIATIGQTILRRGPAAGAWTNIGELPIGANPSSFVNHAPEYLVFEEDQRAPKTSVFLLRDEEVLDKYQYPDEQILSTGPQAFVTYPAGELISSPSKIFLHRMLNHSLDDKQTDVVVEEVIIDDGYQTFITRYDYCTKEAVFDASGRVVQYPLVTKFFEDADGRNVGGSSELHYYNGLASADLKENLQDFYSLLSGWEHCSIDKTADGLPMSRQQSALTAIEVKSGAASPLGVRIPLTILRLDRRDQTDFLVVLFAVPAEDVAGSLNQGHIPSEVRGKFDKTGLPLAADATVQLVNRDAAWIIRSGGIQYPARKGLLGQIEITGEITQQSFFEYETATGHARGESIVYHDWQGHEVTRRTAWTYAWEVAAYAAMSGSRQLTQIAGKTTTNKVAGPGIDHTDTVTSTVTTHSDEWIGTKARAWAPQGSYEWNGAVALAPAFDFSHPQANADWIRQEQVQARIGYGLPRTVWAAGTGPSSTLSDTRQLRSVAEFRNIDLSAPGDPQATYLGFEKYEDLQTWKRDDGGSIGDLITSEDAHTGRCSLKLPGGSSGASIECRLNMPPGTGRCALSYWVKTPPGFPAHAQAGWQITLSDGGMQFEVYPETGGEWRRVQVFVELLGAGGEVVCRAVNRVDNQPVLIDDVSVVPLPAEMQATVFDERTWLTVASLDANAATSRTVYDHFLNPIAQLSPDDQVTSLSAQFFSRLGASKDRFDPAIPNARIEVSCSGGGFLQSLRDASWTERWSPSPASAWSVQQGAITHAGAGAASLTLKNASNESDYGMRTRFMPGADGVNAKIGIAVGDVVKVLWDPAVREWQLLNAKGDVLSKSPCAEVRQSDWLLIAAAHGLAFYCDGQLMLRAWLPQALRGAVQLFTEGNPGVGFTQIMVFYRPRLSVAFTDACGSERQSQQLDRTGTVVQGQLKDRMANASIRTKAMRYQQDMPAYQGNFVTGLDWSTGVMSGELDKYYSGGERSDDEGYPYWRQLFEAAPSPRKIAEGKPGRVLAIRPGNERISTFTMAASTKATMFLELPAGRYFAEMARDPDGNVAATFRDLAGHVLGKSLRAPTSSQEQRSSVGFNARGQVDKVFPPNYYSPPAGSPPDGYIVTRSADVLGRVLESASSDAHLTRCVYDDAGRLRFILPADGIGAGGGGNDRLSYTKYDALGRSIETGAVDMVWDRAQLARLAN